MRENQQPEEATLESAFVDCCHIMGTYSTACIALEVKVQRDDEMEPIRWKVHDVPRL